MGLRPLSSEGQKGATLPLLRVRLLPRHCGFWRNEPRHSYWFSEAVQPDGNQRKILLHARETAEAEEEKLDG